MEAVPISEPQAPEFAAGDDDGRLAYQARTDPDAFAMLYLQHRDAVFLYLRGMLGDEDDALELTAVAFERALNGLARFEAAGGGMRAWLIRIARNAAIDQMRRRRLVFAQSSEKSERRDPDPSPEEAAIASDERRRIRHLLNELPEIQRNAIAMRYGAEMTARDIGAVIGKTEEATQKLISRALARLQEAYRERE